MTKKLAFISSEYQIKYFFSVFSSADEVWCFHKRLETKCFLLSKNVKLINAKPTTSLSFLFFLFSWTRRIMGEVISGNNVCIYAGDVEARFQYLAIKLIRPKNLILFDDGIKSWYINNIKLTQDLYFSHKFYGEVYSEYPLSEISGFKTVRKSIFRQLNPIIVPKTIWIIGQPLIEDKRLSHNEYFQLLTSIDFPPEWEIKYIKHPREELNKKLPSYFKITVLNTSVEDWVLENNSAPELCIGFYSSVLYWMLTYVSDVKVRAKKAPYIDERVEFIYCKYEKCGILLS